MCGPLHYHSTAASSDRSLLGAESAPENTQTVWFCLPACLPDNLTDWLTVSLSSRFTAEGNRIFSGPSDNQKFSVGPSVPVSVDQTFPWAPLEPQHHAPPPPPQPSEWFSGQKALLACRESVDGDQLQPLLPETAGTRAASTCAVLW